MASLTREPRKTCPRCRRAGLACLCSRARPIDSDALFVLLIHPREARRRIGTAPIVTLCLPETRVIRGTGAELDQDPGLLALLSNPRLEPLLLFPSDSAVAVEDGVRSARARGLRPAILVVDGTWSQASKMIRTSRLLGALPRLSFRTDRISAYGFRRQPAAHCLSTVEAVHEALVRSGSGSGLGDPGVLLELFAEMVQAQSRYTLKTRDPEPVCEPV